VREIRTLGSVGAKPNGLATRPTPSENGPSVNRRHPTNVSYRLPGGWLVTIRDEGITFVPDPGHEWDGGSVA
jgi:hypothetical protein